MTFANEKTEDRLQFAKKYNRLCWESSPYIQTCRLTYKTNNAVKYLWQMELHEPSKIY